VCADIDARKIEAAAAERAADLRAGLEELVRRNQAQGRLHFTTDVAGAAGAAEVVFLAVGTPPGEDGSADLRHVLAAAETVGRHVRREAVVITKSTVPVGTAAKVRDVIAAHSHYPVHVCSNPEFLKEGAAVEDFLRPTAWCSAWTATTRARCSPSCTRRSCAPASRSCSWTWRRRS
jgi:UDPglucose 6-dehydrogenase